MKRIIILTCALVLGSCSHSIYLVGQKSGATGTAELTTFGNQSGTINISLNDKIYTGTWVYAPTGGSIMFGSATAVSSTGQSAFASGNAIAAPMGGPGSIIAKAPDGSSIRCSFTYSEWGGTGIGQCTDNVGETYDLQIR
jgi:hypothetical protein